MTMPAAMLSVGDVAGRLSKQPRWVRTHAAVLGGKKLGAQWRFPAEAIDAVASDPVRADAAEYARTLAVRTSTEASQ